MKTRRRWLGFLNAFLVSILALFLSLPFLPALASGGGEMAKDEDVAASMSTVVGGDPWEVTSLDIWKGVDVVRAPGWSIDLEKTASVQEMEMTVGETREVTFTITVEATPGDAYYVAGNIFVENTGEWPADVIGVSDTVWYKAGGSSWLPATSSISTTVPLGDDAIPTGGPHVYSYSGTFTLPVSLEEVTAFSNLIEITISNKPDPPKPGMQNWTFHSREDFSKPTAGGTNPLSLSDVEWMDPAEGLDHEIKSVTINGSPAGSLTGPWELDLENAPYTVVIQKDLNASEPGEYTLHNKAVLDGLEDEVEVEILVRDREPEAGEIRGYKYQDIDLDGQLDQDDPPWEGITIELWKDGVKIDETTTSSDGSFLFTGLEEGEYEVREVLPEGTAAVGPTSRLVWVEEGEVSYPEPAFLNYRIPEEEKGSIGGAKYLDLDADGLLDAGEPGLSGVTIRLYRAEYYDLAATGRLQLAPSWVLVGETSTGESGGFSFGDLPPGLYRVEELVPEGYFPTTNQEFALELGSEEDALVFFLNARMARLSGEKLDYSTGQPIPGVVFILREAGDDGPPLERASDDHGLFDFGWLMPGYYVLEETVPGGWLPVGPAIKEVQLESGDQAHLVFVNRRPASVTGYKWLDENGDGVHQETEPPLKGVRITLRSEEANEEAELLETLTGEDGRFEFLDLYEGTYRLEEEVPTGYYATSPASVDLELQPGQVERVDFLNARLAAVGGYKWLDLDGDGVADETEPGLAGVTINLLDGGGVIIDTRVTTAGGFYLFCNLEPGTYAVEEVVPEGYEATSPTKVSFELLPGEEERVDFLNAVMVGGEVVTPPVTPPLVPIVGGGTGTLPATGLAMTLLLVGIGLLMSSGVLLLSLGTLRRRRTA
ncbi:MAG: hypothetical protein H5T72_06540 [Actinobacteria bacterium]|nr:hypothetical protein [Actinomycetota bacterium]